MAKFGIDISEYQKGFDFDRAIAEGVTFAIIRGGDGNYKDSQFEYFYEQWKARGIPIGVYHYTRCKTVAEAEREAGFFIEQVLQGKKFEYPVYMDVETDAQSTVGKKQLTDTVIAYCEAIRKAGYRPGIYASLRYLESNLEDSRLDAYEKWIAQWSSRCDYTGNLGMWQFGGETNVLRSNQVAGVVCDQNYGYIDYPSLEGSPTVAAVEKKGDFSLEMRVLKAGLTGNDVRALQILLMGNGWDGGTWGADGNFGAQTTQAVTAYQRKENLQVDGMAGPETMTAILGL